LGDYVLTASRIASFMLSTVPEGTLKKEHSSLRWFFLRFFKT